MAAAGATGGFVGESSSTVSAALRRIRDRRYTDGTIPEAGDDVLRVPAAVQAFVAGMLDEAMPLVLAGDRAALRPLAKAAQAILSCWTR